MNISSQIIQETEKRQPDLDLLLSDAKSGTLLSLQSSEQLNKRTDALTEFAPESFRGALERVLGNNDLLPFNYFESGLRVGNAVTRLIINDINKINVSRATGFMISKNLLLTNNHVISDKSFAVNSIAEFNYQFDISGCSSKTTSFELDPDSFFFTSAKFDFTVVAVRETDITGTGKLSDFGYISLNPQKGKVSLGEYLSIIQHPGGQEKQIAIRENQLIDNESDNDFVWYRADTTPGSSGSPVFNDQWQLVALHHSGVPEKDKDGNYLTVDGQAIDPKAIDTIDTSVLKWKANEGVRVSRIVAVLSTDCMNEKLIAELLKDSLKCKVGESTNLIHAENHPEETDTSSSQNSDMTTNFNNGKIELTIPLNITVSLGNPNPFIQLITTSDTPVKMSAPDEQALADFTEGVIIVDQHYGNRKGFDENFVEGAGLPKLNQEQLDNAVRITGSDNYILKYHHFSLVMNRKRKMAFYTAVNIDGKKYNKIKNQLPSRKNIGTDKWYIDPRIEEDPKNPKFQIPASFYAGNDFDIGHQVRREDAVWGDTLEFAIKCNNDTFHLTNACPQHKIFNQGINDKDDERYKNVKGKILWQGLENYILDNAHKNNLNVNVYTGPVFGKNDKEFESTGIRIPKSFWKVVVMAKENGELSATGYLVSQEEQISGMLEEFTFGKFLFYQAPVSNIEKLTGLTFGLSKFDPLRNAHKSVNESMEMEEIKTTLQPLDDLSQIRF